MYRHQFRTNMDEGASLFSLIRKGDTEQLALKLVDDPGLAGHIGNLAATCGNVNVLKWLHAQKYELSPATGACAAGAGHIDLLKWLAAQGLFKDWYVCLAAADGGHLDVLKWAKEQGCVWDNSTLKFAVIKEYTVLCEWAEQHGCPPYEPMTYHFN
jgi:hypothetical protein